MSAAAAYYNENDPRAATWLRELIRAGLIAPGEVDERSIVEVKGADLTGFQQVHLFAGIGGWSYALRLAGIDDAAGVWTASCPCQPFSSVGKRRASADRRHLWPHVRRLVAECQPSVAFGEQVGRAAGRNWLAGVRADLERSGYAVGAADLPAAAVGAPQVRSRLWWGARLLASADQPVIRHLAPAGQFAVGQYDRSPGFWSEYAVLHCADGKRRRVSPERSARPLAPGLPARLGRCRGYGNAICAPLAAAFVRSFCEVI